MTKEREMNQGRRTAEKDLVWAERSRMERSGIVFYWNGRCRSSLDAGRWGE